MDISTTTNLDVGTLKRTFTQTKQYALISKYARISDMHLIMRKHGIIKYMVQLCGWSI